MPFLVQPAFSPTVILRSEITCALAAGSRHSLPAKPDALSGLDTCRILTFNVCGLMPGWSGFLDRYGLFAAMERLHRRLSGPPHLSRCRGQKIQNRKIHFRRHKAMEAGTAKA